MGRLVLYAYTWSSCSWRVRIALSYKGIEYEAVSVKDKKTPEFLAINPAGQIPVLVVDGEIMTESMAMLEYLDERYPEKPLLPKDLVQRAKVREICLAIVSGIQPLQNPRVAKMYSDDPVKQLEWTKFCINRGFALLEKTLKKTSAEGQYCFGDTVTMADCCLAPQVYNAVDVYQMDLSPYPTVKSIYDHLLQLKEVSSGHPSMPFP